MFVLHCMKAGCIIIDTLGTIGYIILLVKMVPALCTPADFLEEIDQWSWEAEHPLFVMLLSVIGFCLCCLAERFSLRTLLTSFELDYVDHTATERQPLGINGSSNMERQGRFSLFIVRLMRHASMVVAILGFMGFALAVLAICQTKGIWVNFKRSPNSSHSLTPSLMVMVLSAIAFGMCCLAERFMVNPQQLAEPTDVVAPAASSSQPHV